MTLLRDEVGAKNFHLTRHSRVTPPYGGGVTPADPSTTREFLEALIAGFSVLGGVMAYFSGFEAYRALAQNEAPSVVAHSINEGVGEGFEAGVPAAIAALMIMGWI